MSGASETAMSEIDTAALRQALRSELGEDRFMIFVRDSHASRFKWWQEKAWDRFTERLPQYRCDLDTLRSILRWCPLHDIDLREDEVELFHGCMDFARDWEMDARLAFPYASSGPIPTQGRETDATTIEVLYCPLCREAEAAYREENRGWVIPKAWLERPVHAWTAADIMRDDLVSMAVPDVQIETLIARAPDKPGAGKLEAFLADVRPSDEIWRFKSPPDTWAKLCGRAGYGIVRDGRCVKIVVTMLN